MRVKTTHRSAEGHNREELDQFQMSHLPGKKVPSLPGKWPSCMLGMCCPHLFLEDCYQRMKRFLISVKRLLPPPFPLCTFYKEGEILVQCLHLFEALLPTLSSCESYLIQQRVCKKGKKAFNRRLLHQKKEKEK